jgi:hypothetical protein
MKNKTIIIISVIIVLLIISIFAYSQFKFEKNQTGIGAFKTVKGLKNPSEAEIIKALQAIANNKNYGLEIAQTVEKIFRFETGHFKSEIFKNTNAAGMIATTNNFPYGWTFILSKLSIFRPIGIYYVNSTNFHYLQFKHTDAFFIVAEIIKQRGRAGFYYSLNEAAAAQYESKLNTITNIFI